MKHQGRGTYLGHDRCHVDFTHRFHDAGGDLGLRRAAHELIEPRQLLVAAPRDEQLGEQVAECGRVRAPTHTHQLHQRLAGAQPFRVTPGPALREPAVDHDVTDALRVTYRVFDGHGSAL